MRLDEILTDVVDAVTGRNHGSDNQDVQPASRDPYGDPADQQVLDASQDPYGDPADQYVADASEDPYGDPADGERPAHSGGLLGRLFGH